MQPSPQSGPRDWSGRHEASPAIGRKPDSGRQLPPTEDPQEALEFCRALSSAMELTSTAEDHRQSPALVAAILGQRAAALPPPMLSIVIPVFNEEENLQTLHSRLTRTLTEQGLDYEIVFVDDGSQDQSPEMLRRLEAEDHRVVVVEFARNFGHQVAISAGLEHCRGRVVSIMD
ncbi:MAG TPA: glycosyltransferase, partial [Nitrospira sp.]|nr:glycosyltransferase [Nitrospira sp.]